MVRRTAAACLIAAWLSAAAACGSDDGAAPDERAPTSSTTSPAGDPDPGDEAPADPEPSGSVDLLPAVEPAGEVRQLTVEVEGTARPYRLYVPSTLPAGPAPLFVALHGGTGWGDQFAATNEIEGLAEANGFLVAHPTGTLVGAGPGATWNGGYCCGPAARTDVDDVGFVSALLDDVGRAVAVDPDRTYALGHSNGGIMSYRLACELSDRIVGVGVVAGSLGVDGCAPTEPVSLIHLHGTADRNHPLEGGVGPDSIAGVEFDAAEAGVGAVADADGCPADPAVTSAGDLTTSDWAPCDGGAAVRFVVIEGASHAWPGAARAGPSGAPYPDLDATAEIVAFLLAHPRR